MAEKRIIVIGGSAGSLDVIFRITQALPAQFRIPIVVVVHRSQSSDNMLARLLEMKTSLRIREIEDKDPIEDATIYIAPGDYHLLLEYDFTFSLDASEKIRYSRPSIDITFESVAELYGRGCTAILLSGANSDGTAGLAKVKEHGGRVIVQDPDSAEVPFMPQYALTQVEAAVLNVDGICALFRDLLMSD